LADGAALGASLYCRHLIRILIIVLVSGMADAQNAGLGVLIFLAIFLHKAPAAIGFGTFL
jgi:hypothetical protein